MSFLLVRVGTILITTFSETFGRCRRGRNVVLAKLLVRLVRQVFNLALMLSRPDLARLGSSLLQ